jgi:hypothetical protein
MRFSFDEFDVHNVAPLDVQAYITTTPYPGTQVFQLHWAASFVQVYHRTQLQLHDIVHLDDTSTFAQSFRGEFIGISRLREGWADIKIRRQGLGRSIPCILTIPIEFVRLTAFWRLKLAYLERLRPRYFAAPDLMFFNQPVSVTDDIESEDSDDEPPLDLGNTLDLIHALNTVERLETQRVRRS